MSFKCNVCNNKYKTLSTMNNHIKKYHENNTTNKNDNNTNNNTPNINLDNQTKKYKCRTCDKQYNYVQGRWKHEKICKNPNDKIIQKYDEIKKELDDIKKNISININNGVITPFSLKSGTP